MKNKQVVSYALIGLVLAGLGFANFLAQRGSLSGIFNKGEATSTQTGSDLELSDLSRLKMTDDSITYFASESATSNNSASDSGTSMGAYLSPVIIEPQLVTITATQSGQTAFSLLLSSVPDVTYKKYDFGFYIESINNLPGNNENFWAFYLNGEKSAVGADSVVLKQGEVVEFKYEKVEF